MRDEKLNKLASLAQLVEQWTFNPWVVSSSLTGGTGNHSRILGVWKRKGCSLKRSNKRSKGLKNPREVTASVADRLFVVESG